MSAHETFDAAIVGAGPAGCAAALVLARAGHRVVIFERAEIPRDKVCGDLLGTEAVAALRHVGFGPSVLSRAFAIDGAVLHGPRGDRFGARETHERAGARPRAYVIRRRTFDAALLRAAEDAGADVRIDAVTDVARDSAGRVVGVCARAGTVAARATIAADGWGSSVARTLGVPRRDARNVAVATRAYAAGVRGLGTRMHFFINRSGDGYGWIFPLGDGEANVGLGYLRDEESLDLSAVWTRFLRGAATAPYLRDASVERTKTWPIPIGPRRADAAIPGVFFAGDAATLASPISGSGIAHALTSGAAAARYARRALAGDERAWSAYARHLDRTFAPRSRIEASLHSAVATPEAFERASFVLGIPGACEALSRAMLALG